MPADPAGSPNAPNAPDALDALDVLAETDHLRHELLTPVTIISGRTQLLLRQLIRMDGMATGDRQRLEAGLDEILQSARRLALRIDEVAARQRKDDG